MTDARRIFVTGRVQGVGFRWWTQRRAVELEVVGWVRNLDDGRVEVHVEGEPEAVKRMYAELRSGPAHARVMNASASEAVVEDRHGFEVLPTAPG